MQPSEIFSLTNTLAMIMWLLMIFLPKWKVTKVLIDYKIVPILLSIIYVIYIGINISRSGFPQFGSLSSVMALFTDEAATLAGWAHYLAFDLLVGMWILDRNKKYQIHHILLIPSLICTFMLGPVGFLLFLITSTFKTKSA